MARKHELRTFFEKCCGLNAAMVGKALKLTRKNAHDVQVFKHLSGQPEIDLAAPI